MALSTATYTKSTTIPVDVSERSVTYTGTVAIGASPGTYATGGLTLNLASGTLQGGVPDEVRIESLAGYVYKYVGGTNITDGKILVFGQEPTDTTSDVLPLAQLGAAATPAGVSGDTITIRFKMRKGK